MMSILAEKLTTYSSETAVETKNQKLYEVNFLQTFGIILVVLGHSHPLNVDYPPFYSILITFIYSFHMPLFMCISGYLFQYSGGMKNNSYWNFLKKKSVRLLLPYAVISSIMYIPKAVLFGEASSRASFDLSVAGYLHSLLYPRLNVLGHFWFLPTLFLIFLVSPILYKLNNGRKMNAIFAASLFLLLLNLFIPSRSVAFLNLSETATLIIYFWTGCVLARYRSNIIEIAKGKYYLPPIFAAVTFFSASGIITGVMGILMSLSITLIYMRNKSSFIRYIDGYSYQIYLLHWPVQAIAFVLFYKVLHLSFYTTALFMLVIGIASSFVIIKFTVKYIPFFKKIIGL